MAAVFGGIAKGQRAVKARLWGRGSSPLSIVYSQKNCNSVRNLYLTE